jgi:hypothetical protein
MREQSLGQVTVGEVLNGGYEALKAVVATRLAMLVSPDDVIRARHFADSIAEEIDDARHDFIIEMRRVLEAQPEVEGEVVDG